jgi:hypothetical protein
MKIKVEFSGGLELLFSSQKRIDIEVEHNPFSIGDLIEYLRVNNLKEKEEMFI